MAFYFHVYFQEFIGPADDTTLVTNVLELGNIYTTKMRWIPTSHSGGNVGRVDYTGC